MADLRTLCAVLPLGKGIVGIAPITLTIPAWL
jgi:hypothetical protein